MKINNKKKVLTFADLITAAYDACGENKAKAMIQLACNSHLVVFRGKRCVEIS